MRTTASGEANAVAFPIRWRHVTLSLVILILLLSGGFSIWGRVAWALPPPPLDGRLLPAWFQIEKGTGAEAGTVTELLQGDGIEGEGPWVVRAYYVDRRMVYDLATWIEPWEVHHDQGYLVVGVNRTECDRLLAAGFRLEVDERLTALLNQPNVRLPGQASGIPGYPCYRTVEETFDAAQAMVAAHPDLATWIDVGDSWEKSEPGGHPGYDLMVLQLTNATVPGPKPKLFVMSSVHAREYAPAELNTRFAEYLVDNYGLDPDATWLLDYHEIHLLLHANPDGRKKAEAGLWWRKNTNENYCFPTSNYRGADLNRNFEFQWGCCGGSSGNGCDETYRGPSPASEPETQAIQDYVRSQFPDQRGVDLSAPAPIMATGVFLDVHSYGQLVLWPWGFTSATAPNSTALQTLGRKLSYFNGYEPDQAIGLYPTDGTTDDFAYGELGLAAYTFELGTTFFQNCTTFENTILPDNLPALIYAAKVSRAPYLTPSGPDALDAAVSPIGVIPGEPVLLTATVDDTRYSDQNGTEPTQAIAAAEYYIDIPPWITTTTPASHSMTASDGFFDAAIEDVEAVVDTAGLSAGRHTIFLRGQDSAGNWGAFSAVFVHVLETGVSPVIEGYVREAYTGTPLEATVTANTFQAGADPATGYYSMTVVSDTYSISTVAPGHMISTVTSIVASDYQTVRQDFSLLSTCQILTDDVESGNLGWTAQSPWTITTEASHSPTHAWTDSPGSDYSNNCDVSLRSPVLDLSGLWGVTLSFWHIYDLQGGYDYGYVEYSTDGGITWTVAGSYSGEGHTTWTRVEIDLPALDDQPNGRLRFRLHSNALFTRDGWHIDDIVLSGGGLACARPAAGFTASSPIGLGRPVTFTNRTKGAEPLDYWWDFGDGLGTSIQRDPVYTYVSTGTFTVTLVATNSLGSDRASQSVTVLSPTYGLVLAPTTATRLGDLGASVTYTLFITNTGNMIDRCLLAASGNAWTTTLSVDTSRPMLPLDAISVQVKVDVPLGATVGQTDTAAITATSQTDSRVYASGLLTTTAVDICYPVAIIHLASDAPVIVGQTMHVAAVVVGDPHLPITYTWNWGDGTVPEVGVGLNVVSHTYGAVGTYTVTLDVANGCPSSDRAELGVRVDLLYRGVALDPPADARFGVPGTTVTYTLTAHNLGNAQDSFDVSLSGNTWDVASAAETFGPIAAGAADTLAVYVAIPVTATEGMTDVVDVRITSVGDPTESSSSTLMTTVGRNKLYLPLITSARSGTLVGPRSHTSEQDKISSWVLAATADHARTDLLVVLAEQADLSPAYDLPTKQARGRWVYETLWQTAQRSQASVRAWLDAQGVAYRSFYIVNMLHVQGGDRALAEKLAARRDVMRIEANPRIRTLLPEPMSPEMLPETGFSANYPAFPDTVEWNIQKVNAPAVWAMGYAGQGVVVGGQDTGYDWDHPALKDQYRGWDGVGVDHDYNWHDAAAGSLQPVDPHSHGTHTMGTLVGDDGGSNQIGMAPGARWMGCRNMDSSGYGTPATYLECFEFFLAPYPVDGDPSQGDPAMAPDVTNNSWTCPSSEGCSWSTLQAAVEAQRAAGIMTIVSAGNSGSSCSTVREPPAIYDASYTVGATDSSDSIVSFSSRGPVTVDGSNRLKPDISAPGLSVRSCIPGTGYGTKSGTSMAAPHVAGAVALIWSADPALRNQIDQTEQVLNTAALPRYSAQCGDPSDTVPNNVYGWGRVDVLAAVRQVLPPPELAVVKTPSKDRAHVGALLRYTITVSNTGGPATDVTIRDALPPDTEFAGVGDGGAFVGDGVVWSGGSVPASGTITVHYAVTVTCVPSGTRIPNAIYYVTATEWPTPTFGSPVTVTAIAEDVSAGFAVSTPVLTNWPVTFTNLSRNATIWEWDFGDGFTSTLLDPTHVYTGVGTYTATLTAGNVCVSDTFRGSLAVEEYALVLGPPVAEGRGDPGQVVTYTLYVTNTGTVTSAFGLSVGDHTWSTELSTGAIEPLGPDESAPFQVYITVDAGAYGDDKDTAVVRVASASDPRIPPAHASIAITTVATSIYGVALEPAAASRVAAPGQAVTYTLGVTNTGNATDVYTLTLSGYIWTVTFSIASGTTMLPAIGPLGPGESGVVAVGSWIPLSAHGGDSDTAIVTVTSQGDDTKFAVGVLTTTAVHQPAMFKFYLPLILR
jgi:carboxypeptidase T